MGTKEASHNVLVEEVHTRMFSIQVMSFERAARRRIRFDSDLEPGNCTRPSILSMGAICMISAARCETLQTKGYACPCLLLSSAHRCSQIERLNVKTKSRSPLLFPDFTKTMPPPKDMST